ncbi:uncharacterized protein LOC123553458 [Mercenaria mercenaria]|uniref:uncharacterized protein LOC123553458 n=1 Tax=Mercenaria mercenaria TaxID=6596 RepID=UPI00234EFD34|nr:uncharacterized protein LOC123553458 [Mercenaria mercenaria]
MSGYVWLIDHRRSQHMNQRKIPKKIKSVIDDDLATFCEDRSLTRTQVRLREKLKRKQSSEIFESQVSQSMGAVGTRTKQRSNKRKKNRRKHKTTLDENLLPDDKPALIEGTACDVLVSHIDKFVGTESDDRTHKEIPMDLEKGDAKIEHITKNMPSCFERKEIAKLLAIDLENFRRDLRKRPMIELQVFERKGQIAKLNSEVMKLRMELSKPPKVMCQTLQNCNSSKSSKLKPEMPYNKHDRGLSSAEKTLRMLHRTVRQRTCPGICLVFGMYSGILNFIDPKNRFLLPIDGPPTAKADKVIKIKWINEEQREVFIDYLASRLVSLYRRYFLPPRQIFLKHRNSRQHFVMESEAMMLTIYRMLTMSYLAQLLQYRTKQNTSRMENSSLPNSTKGTLLLFGMEVKWMVSILQNAYVVQCKGEQLLTAGTDFWNLLEGFAACLIHQTPQRKTLSSELMYIVRKMISANKCSPNSVTDGNLLTPRRYCMQSDRSLQNVRVEGGRRRVRLQACRICDDGDLQENYGIRLCLCLE